MITGMLLARNESGRYIERVLEQMRSVCDKIIVLDDCSTDDTPEICRSYGAEVFYSDRPLWGANELIQRKRLWETATKQADRNTWLLCLDADETIQHIDLLPGKIKLAEQYDCDGISFNLYDMWTPTHYRDDDLWTAHARNWVMCVRYDPEKEYVWHEAALHCGRFPLNACEYVGQTGIAIQHWGWSIPEDRRAKYKRYMKADPGGKDGNLAQYQSILDPDPILKEFSL